MLSDGDLVTISDSSDVMSAVQFSDTLKLHIFLNSPNEDSVESKCSKEVANVGAIKKELSEIQYVIHVLDQLEIASQVPARAPNPDPPFQIASDNQTVQPVKPASTQSNEFDRYEEQNSDVKEADKVSEVGPNTQNENVAALASRPPIAVIRPTIRQPLASNETGYQPTGAAPAINPYRRNTATPYYYY